MCAVWIFAARDRVHCRKCPCVRLSQATDQIRTTSPYDMALRTSERHFVAFYCALAEFFVGVISNPINTHICVVCNVIIAHPLVFCQGFFRFSFSVMIIACETKNGWKIDLNIFIANILPILRHPIRLKSNGAGARGGNLGVSKKSSRPPAGELPIILKVILPRSLSSTACLKMKKFLFLSLTL